LDSTERGSRHELLWDITASCKQSCSDVCTGVIEVWWIESTIYRNRNNKMCV
jgi:hypothetical protein